MTDRPMPMDEAIDHWKRGMSCPQKVERLRAALQWIADQESLTFAECSLAEEIIQRARAALKDTADAP